MTSTHQQSLADARKFIKLSIDVGLYEFKKIQAIATSAAMTETEDDLAGDDLKQYKDKVKRLMQGIELSKHERESRCINKFDKFTSEAGESLTSMFEQWNKYVINVLLSKNLGKDPYDVLFDHLQQYEGLLNASRAKRAANTYDLLALVANTYARSSSSWSPPTYYVTHPSLVMGYDNDYQGEAICNDQEDSLTTAMMLLACAITQRYSTPINNHLRTSSNTRNQAVVEDDHVDIQSKNVGNSGHYARDCPKPRVCNSKYFQEQILLVRKDEAGIMLKDEQNEFILEDACKIEEFEVLSATVCIMAQIQQEGSDSKNEPDYDYEFISEVSHPSMSFINKFNSKSDHEQNYHEQPGIIKSTIGDDQTISDIIFDDPNVEVND
ncbi:hypothetical protein Tco_0356567 [Tanacetum coccineum]